MRRTVRPRLSTLAVLLLPALLLSACGTGCPQVCLGQRPGAVDWSGRDLSGARIIGTELRQADLSRARLAAADLSGSSLTGVDLTGADLQGASLVGTDLQGSVLTGANLAGTDMSGASLVRADLTGVVLSSARLNAVNFIGARMANAVLSQQDLSGVYLIDTQLSGARLDRAGLAGSVMDRVDLSGADLRWADLAGSWLNLATLVAADLSNANLRGASLIGADLSGARLTGAFLTGANLTGADLSGADLRGVDLSAALLLAPPDGLDKAALADDLLKNLSASQWEALQLGDAVLDGIRYDRSTRWPTGFQPPASAILVTAPVGSAAGSGLKTGEQLAVAIGAQNISRVISSLALAYMQRHPELFFYTVGSDSSTGIQAAGAGYAHVGFSTRGVSPEEASQYPELRQYLLGREALAVIAHPGLSLADLPGDELAAILSGGIRDWSALGGEALPVQLFLTADTRAALLDNGSLAQAAAAGAAGTDLPTDAAVRAAVAQTEGAIGLVSLQMADRSVRRLPVNGVDPDADSIRSGEYLLTQPLYLVTAGEAQGWLQDWVAFIYSPDGSAVLRTLGVEPSQP